jgi:hypothetical protein
LGSYRCYGSWRQRQFQYANCTTIWVNITECTYGCINGTCCTGPGEIPGCGVEIKTLDYLDNVAKGATTQLTATVRNTGDSTQTINLYLYVNSQLKAFRSRSIASGSEGTELLAYTSPSSAGSYALLLNATAGCGSYEAKQATLHVIETAAPVIVLPPQPPAPPPQVIETNVMFYPASLDMELYAAKAVTVDITSAQIQGFSINASGMPLEWLEYDETFSVGRGNRIAYIYVTPEQLGNYSLAVSARAESEGKDFSSVIEIYVAPPWIDTGEGGFIGRAMKLLGEAILLISNNFWAVVLLVIIALLAVIILGAHRLRTEHWPLK